MHAHITAYKGKIVCELLADKSIEGEVTTSLDRPGNFGQIIHDTAKHLGVSAEAMALLKTIRPGHDSLGDIDWFGTSDGAASFGWIGGPYNIVDPKKCDASRDYKILGYVEIPNDVPEGAKAAIDSPDEDDDE